MPSENTVEHTAQLDSTPTGEMGDPENYLDQIRLALVNEDITLRGRVHPETRDDAMALAQHYREYVEDAYSVPGESDKTWRAVLDGYEQTLYKLGVASYRLNQKTSGVEAFADLDEEPQSEVASQFFADQLAVYQAVAGEEQHLTPSTLPSGLALYQRPEFVERLVADTRLDPSKLQNVLQRSRKNPHNAVATAETKITLENEEAARARKAAAEAYQARLAQPELTPDFTSEIEEEEMFPPPLQVPPAPLKGPDVRLEKALNVEEAKIRLKLGIKPAIRLENGEIYHELLTQEQVVALSKMKDAGSVAAINLMMENNQRMVAHEARRYQDQGVDIEDLEEEGNIGLRRAVEKYDYRLGTTFSTYAMYWLHVAMQRAIENTGRTIRRPINIGHELRRVARAVEKLQKRGDHVTDEALANETGFSVTRIQENRHDEKHSESVSTHIKIGGTETSLAEMVGDERHDTEVEALDAVTRDEQRREISTALRQLSREQHVVLSMLFGIGQEPKKQREVGEILGVSIGRIQKVRDDGIERLGRLLDYESLAA